MDGVPAGPQLQQVGPVMQGGQWQGGEGGEGGPAAWPQLQQVGLVLRGGQRQWQGGGGGGGLLLGLSYKR